MLQYFDRVTSESAFAALFASEGGKVFVELEIVAASSWTRANLLACRLVRNARQDSILPVLLQHIPPIGQLHNEMAELVKGPDAAHRKLGEPELVHLYGVSRGQVWAALASFDFPPGEVNRPANNEDGQGRTVRQVVHEGYVDSSRMRVGSSSPLSGSGSSKHGMRESQASSSVGWVSDDTHIAASLPEDKTVRLVSCFIRHILYYFPPQSSERHEPVVGFRDEKISLSADIGIHGNLRAIDDGGLYRRIFHRSDQYEVDNSHVAILEAKRRFQHIQDGRPITTD